MRTYCAHSSYFLMYHLFLFFILEPLPDKATFYQWKQDDVYFVSTRASKKVEKMTENHNLVIVTGHSGY